MKKESNRLPIGDSIETLTEFNESVFLLVNALNAVKDRLPTSIKNVIIINLDEVNKFYERV